MEATRSSIAKMIDHALLNPSLAAEELERGIQTALHYQVASVCILPFYLKRCAQILDGSGVKAGTTIGFPHGGQTTRIKIAEAEQALADGANELDIVINVNQAISKNWCYVEQEIRTLTELVQAKGSQIKVIFENCYLNEEQKIRLCEICSDARADWAKTSTGFGTGGATVEDVLLMRKLLPPEVQVKAAGGIRNLETLLAFRAAGATRIGCSNTAKILEECQRADDAT